MSSNRQDLQNRIKKIEQAMNELKSLRKKINDESQGMVTIGEGHLRDVERELKEANARMNEFHLDLDVYDLKSEKDRLDHFNTKYFEQIQEAVKRAESKIIEACDALELDGKAVDVIDAPTIEILGRIKNKYAHNAETIQRKASRLPSFITTTRTGKRDEVKTDSSKDKVVVDTSDMDRYARLIAKFKNIDDDLDELNRLIGYNPNDDFINTGFVFTDKNHERNLLIKANDLNSELEDLFIQLNNPNNHPFSKEDRIKLKVIEEKAKEIELNINKACKKLEKNANTQTKSVLTGISNRHAHEKQSLFTSFISTIREKGEDFNKYATEKSKKFEESRKNSQLRVSAGDLASYIGKQAKSKTSALANSIYSTVRSPKNQIKDSISKIEKQLAEYKKHYPNEKDMPMEIKQGRNYLLHVKSNIDKKDYDIKQVNHETLTNLEERLDTELAAIKWDKKYSK